MDTGGKYNRVSNMSQAAQQAVIRLLTIKKNSSRLIYCTGQHIVELHMTVY